MTTDGAYFLSSGKNDCVHHYSPFSIIVRSFTMLCLWHHCKVCTEQLVLRMWLWYIQMQILLNRMLIFFELLISWFDADFVPASSHIKLHKTLTAGTITELTNVRRRKNFAGLDCILTISAGVQIPTGIRKQFNAGFYFQIYTTPYPRASYWWTVMYVVIILSTLYWRSVDGIYYPSWHFTRPSS